MKKFLLLVAAIALSLCGCGEEQVFATGELYGLEIPLSSHKYLLTEFPSSLTLLETDNNVFWTFDHDVNLYAFPNSAITWKHNTDYEDVEKSSDSVTKYTDYGRIVIECPSYMQDTFVELLGNATVMYWEFPFVLSRQLKELPEYEEVEMALDERSFYMPLESSKNDKSIYLSALCTDGTDWIESWTKDVDGSTLILQLAEMAVCNSSTEFDWYQSSDILYIECGDHICAAKALSYNQWCIYSASARYKNHVIQALYRIHRGE